MEDAYLIVGDILSSINVNVIEDVKDKIDDTIQLILYDHNRNRIAINLLNEIKTSINIFVRNIKYNCNKLTVHLKSIENVYNKINSINNKIGRSEENKNYGTKEYANAKYFGELKNKIKNLNIKKHI